MAYTRYNNDYSDGNSCLLIKRSKRNTTFKEAAF